MKDHINNALQRFQNTRPSNPTHSLHPHQNPAYGATTKHSLEPENSLPLCLAETTKLQAITGTLLHYARAVDNKMLVDLGSIVTQTHALTKKTFDLITHL